MKVFAARIVVQLDIVATSRRGARREEEEEEEEQPRGRGDFLQPRRVMFCVRKD
jgi:hypothetical protein